MSNLKSQQPEKFPKDAKTYVATILGDCTFPASSPSITDHALAFHCIMESDVPTSPSPKDTLLAEQDVFEATPFGDSSNMTGFQ